MYIYLQLLLLSKMVSMTDWQCELTYTDDVGVVYGNNNNSNNNNG